MFPFEGIASFGQSPSSCNDVYFRLRAKRDMHNVIERFAVDFKSIFRFEHEGFPTREVKVEATLFGTS
jgi:hypothetical protein